MANVDLIYMTNERDEMTRSRGGDNGMEQRRCFRRYPDANDGGKHIPTTSYKLLATYRNEYRSKANTGGASKRQRLYSMPATILHGWSATHPKATSAFATRSVSSAICGHPWNHGDSYLVRTCVQLGGASINEFPHPSRSSATLFLQDTSPSSLDSGGLFPRDGCNDDADTGMYKQSFPSLAQLRQGFSPEQRIFLLFQVNGRREIIRDRRNGYGISWSVTRLKEDSSQA